MTNEEAKFILANIDRRVCDDELSEALDMAIEALEQQKTGHWIVLKDEWGDIHEAVCSCCDDNGHHKWKYCPNCGAKMESEE